MEIFEGNNPEFKEAFNKWKNLSLYEKAMNKIEVFLIKLDLFTEGPS
jgi:hypothetical protein